MASARDVRVLNAIARRLNRAHGGGRAPSLFFLTDPSRTPAPEAAIARLPPGAGVIYRHFGAPDRAAVARRLAALCRRRRLKLLIAADPALARRIGADGAHLPERMARHAFALKRARPAWIVTAAWHGRRPPPRGADALLLSPVFPSASPSAGPVLGPRAGAAIAQRAGGRVYALGGMSAQTASRLRGFAGLAAIDGLLLD